MNTQRALCPQCRSEIVFEDHGGFRRCPQCGFQFEISAPSRLPAAGLSPDALSFVGVLLRFFLIAAAVVIVGLGVLFIGCAVAFKL